VDIVQVTRLERIPYQAAVPPRIADLEPFTLLEPRLVREVTEVEGAIAAFNTEVARLPVPMPAVLLRTESASSSQIEHLTSSARSLAVASLGLNASKNARLVARNVAAMRESLAIDGPVTASMILRIHEALLGDSDPEIAGAWRDGPVWIGKPDLSPHGADFIPPTYERVPELVADLVAFCARPHISVLASAVVAHAQFETIHPFTDGNGRTGRALVHSMLRESKLSLATTVPISAGLLGDTEAYFDALTAYREGDVNPIVAAFAAAARRALVNSHTLAHETMDLRASWRDSIKARSDSIAWRLADHLFAQPVVSSEYVEQALAVSRSGAYNAIDVLVSAGVLAQPSNDRRNRLWQATDVLTIMDDFAKRSTRRRL
jgi:Fic family protein